MKNRFLLLVIMMSIFIISKTFAEENKFEVENIELKNYGDLIIATNGKFNTEDGKFVILADKFIYNKESKLLDIFNGEATSKTKKLTIKFKKSQYNENNLKLIAEGNIKIDDSDNNLLIESDVITLDRKKDFITAEGNIKIDDTDNNLLIEGESVLFDRTNQLISSKRQSSIKDGFDNVF